MVEVNEEEVIGIGSLEGLDSPFNLMMFTRVRPVISGWIFQLDWARTGPT
jgi:hypothetical protein